LVDYLICPCSTEEDWSSCLFSRKLRTAFLSTPSQSIHPLVFLTMVILSPSGLGLSGKTLMSHDKPYWVGPAELRIAGLALWLAELLFCSHHSVCVGMANVSQIRRSLQQALRASSQSLSGTVKSSSDSKGPSSLQFLSSFSIIPFIHFNDSLLATSFCRIYRHRRCTNLIRSRFL
jgi:hypothetical protein